MKSLFIGLAISQLHTAKELGHLSQAEYAANIKAYQQEVKTVVNKFNTRRLMVSDAEVRLIINADYTGG